MPAVGVLRDNFNESPMKRPGLTPHLLAATLFLTPGLRAQDAKSDETASSSRPATAPSAAPMRSARAAELLKRFDKNGDGKLDDDELAEAHEVMMKEQMARQAAKSASPEGGERFRQMMLEMFDKNHDGRLDDDERAEARKYAEAHGLGEGGAVREALIKRFDKNRDGKLDAAETAELRKFLEARRASGAGPLEPAAQPAPPAPASADSVAEVLAKRRAESLKNVEQPK
jgi:hypothetical protein